MRLVDPLCLLAASVPCLGFTVAAARMFLAGLVWQGVMFTVLAPLTVPLDSA